MKPITEIQRSNLSRRLFSLDLFTAQDCQQLEMSPFEDLRAIEYFVSKKVGRNYKNINVQLLMLA